MNYRKEHMNNIACYFGSFNPIHDYHVAIANHLIEHENMDSVQIILSPQSPFKSELASFEDRYAMCNIAVSDYDRITVNDVEKDMPLPSFSIDTMNKLEKSYPFPHNSLYFVMGIDNWVKIHEWKNFKDLLVFPILVIPRNMNTPGAVDYLYDSTISYLRERHCYIHPKTRLIHGMPLNNISASYIRDEIRNKKNIAPYINPEVNNFIQQHNLYK